MLVSLQESEVPELEVPAPPPRTLGDVRDFLLGLVAVDPREIKLQLSAINTVARASHCAPEDLPADPAQLRGHLQLMSPAMAGLTKGSWSSVRSRILKALQRANVPVMDSKRTRPLSEAWAPLYQAIPANGHRASLGRLVGYLSEQGVPPHEVTDASVGAFARLLASASLRGRPEAVVRAAVRGWNAAVGLVPGWPGQRLAMPETERKGYVLPVAAFPLSFQVSLRDYMDFLRDPPEEDYAPWRGLKASTLTVREFQIRQMASALVLRGVAADRIINVEWLSRKDSIDAICDFFIERHGRSDAVQLGGMLAAARAIAIHRMQDRDRAAWIGRRLKKLYGGRLRRFGMTEKNRRRLSSFRDPQQVRDLLLLPYRLLKRAQAEGLSTIEAAKLVRAAVAIEIEIMCPIRLQNLSEIDVDKDFVRSRRGKKTTVHLFIPSSRTKNGEEIEFEIPAQSLSLIDLYLTKYRNHLIDPQRRGRGPRFLFPRSDGGVTTGKNLAAVICKVLLRELDITFNFHLFRHLGCYLYLKAHPSEIDVMRRVLGHTDSNTTRRFYSFIEQSDAFRQFDTHVLRIREEALRPTRAERTQNRGGR